jgi:hypothetical protein
VPVYRINGQNVLFIHIPKAAGTSVHSWLSEHGAYALYYDGAHKQLPCTPRHFHVDLLKDVLGAGFIDYAFTITRDPLSRAMSEYKWRSAQRPQVVKVRNLKTGFRSVKKYGFEPWFERAVALNAQDPFHLDNHLRPQVAFSAYPGCKVFRLEDGLDQALSQVAR